MNNKSPQQTLEQYANKHIRVRIFYGDKETGRDWLEEYATSGYVYKNHNGVIGLSYNINHHGYGRINFDTVVKIVVNNSVVYIHSKYNHPEFKIGKPPIKIRNVVLADEGYTYGVYVGDENFANFKSFSKAERFIDYMLGYRMNK